MVIDMNDARLETIEQIREFLAGTADVAFSGPPDESSRHAFVANVLRRLRRIASIRFRASARTVA